MRIICLDKLEKAIKEKEKQAIQEENYSKYFMLGLMRSIIEEIPISETEIFYDGQILANRLGANIPIDPNSEIMEFLSEVYETWKELEE